MYKRVLLKLSGEALSNGKDNPFYEEHLQNVALEIKEAVASGVQVAIVVGGGNLYRGKIGVSLGMDRATGDYMGMLATVMNALAISNALTKNNVDNVVMTSIEMKGLAEHFTAPGAIKALNEGKVVVFGGGTGHPYFSTDTGIVLRAIEMEADGIYLAKAIDGVYDSDPKVNPAAVKYDEVSIQEVIDKKLAVVDLTASIMCMENKMPMYVFGLNEENSIVKAMTGEFNGTKVTV